MDTKIARLFPVLEGVPIEYRWGGDVAITLNRAPDFGRLDDNLFYAQGYSGHGMAMAGLAGKLMSDAIAGQSEGFDTFAAMPHRHFPGDGYCASHCWCWPPSSINFAIASERGHRPTKRVPP
nr:FAD-binding oxidoreductase [Halomonas elongata]